MTKRSRGEGSIYLRGKTWWIAYYAGSRQVQESSKSPKQRDAEQLLRRRLGELGTQTYIGPQCERVTFEDLCERIRTAYRVEDRKSLRRMEEALANLANFFAGQRAMAIGLSSLEAYAVRRQEQRAARATAAYELAILRRAFTLAVRGNLIPRRPPFPTIRLNNARQGFFEPDELERILANLPDPLRPMIRFAYLTGWRIPSEVLRLQWHQVDLATGVVRLEPGSTKNDEGRTFPVAALPALAELLQQQRAVTDEAARRLGQVIPWVFHREGQPIKDYRDAWKRGCTKAGLVGMIPHDFRRSAVRNLERAGVPRSVAMKLTGHKTEAVYKRYAIVSESDLSEGVAKLNRLMTAEQQQSRALRRVRGREVSA